ncbi:hypothetical protein [Asanoa ferruginea]|uniref:hypothetical protein n=1 Tax=Asanoa ferruginea TaxID=53367 RepID=UPI000E238ADC|nr:hypothetical protein [Asanoa ferruginea]
MSFIDPRGLLWLRQGDDQPVRIVLPELGPNQRRGRAWLKWLWAVPTSVVVVVSFAAVVLSLAALLM